MIVILRGILLISFACLGIAQNATNETIIVPLDPLVNNSLPLISLNTSLGLTQNATNETAIVPLVNSTILLEPLNSTSQNVTQENAVTPVENNNFTLKGYYEVTTSTLNNSIPLNLTDLSVIANDTKLVILVPCREYFNIPPYKRLITAYKDAGNYTVVNFDWKTIANYSNSPEEHVEIAGNQLAMFIVALRNRGINESNIHIIGDGQGVKVASQSAKIIRENHSGRIGRLTAINPPGKSFWCFMASLFKDDDTELNPEDAIQIDTLTTMGHSSSGGIDFFANKGKKQPGCYDENSCYFERSVDLWTESIQSKNFIAQKCTHKFLGGWKCSEENSIVFGEHMPAGIFEGSYVFYTNSVPPYARG